ncbi:MAG: MarR family winged helix-turn-helix transcriptional regulator, partial [Vicinamibacterales bacterium]
TNISRTETTDVQRVMDGIRRLIQGLREASTDTERRSGLTGAQHFVLRRLAERDGLTVNDLAARTFTHQSTVSVVVSRLVGRGLVDRRADARDRRRRVLSLTPAGRRVLRKAVSPAQERLIAAVMDLPPARRRDVARALGRMADAVAAGRRPTMFFETPGRA